VLTIGVEEEFLLLDPAGAVAPVGADVLAGADAGGQLKTEFMAYPIESASRVCAGLDELRAELVRLRLQAAHGAERAGARLVAAGLPPYQDGPLQRVTADPRYRELTRRYPWAAHIGGACAYQVHVGIPDRELGADVLSRLRPWLATLLTLSGNSPIVDGADTGWSSRRYPALLRWPTFRPAQAGTGAGGYDRAVRALVARGAAVDARSIYFLARLSPRYPTVEIRLADTCLTTEDAVLLAGVARGLVAALIADSRRGRAADATPPARISGDLLAAARYGMAPGRGAGLEPGGPTDAAITSLYRKIQPELYACGDAEDVARGLERLRRTGTGADRQRRLWTHSGSRRAFVAGLSRAAVPAPAPP
jgi:glutamate---cysteine ligase / carboxylate-amine ligase